MFLKIVMVWNEIYNAVLEPKLFKEIETYSTRTILKQNLSAIMFWNDGKS